MLRNRRGSSAVQMLGSALAFMLCCAMACAAQQNAGKAVQKFGGAEPQSLKIDSANPLKKTKELVQVPASVLSRNESTTGTLPTLALSRDVSTTGTLPPLFLDQTTSTPAELASQPSFAFESTDTSSLLYNDLLLSDTLDLAQMEFEDLDTTVGGATPLLVPVLPFPEDELDALTTATEDAHLVTVMSAVCRSLECNQALRIERLNPEIRHTSIETAESAFDTTLNARVYENRSRTSTLGPESRDDDAPERVRDRGRTARTQFGEISLDQRFPTGTDVTLGFNTQRTRTGTTLPFYNSDLNLGITQNLLKGAGCEVNCIRVWTAQNNFVISLYQLQNELINLVDDVQNSYWDLYLAIRTLEIRREAYRVAREQRERTEEFVRVGSAPPLEALASQAEESARISDIISAVADVRRKRLTLLRLLNPVGFEECWDTVLYPAEEPVLPSEFLEPTKHVRIARYFRPDLRQAQIDLANNELEVVRTENGLLPALDFFTNVTFSGSEDTFQSSVKQIRKGSYYNYRVGMQFSYALQNRAARADYRRANFSRQQAEESIRNFEELIEIDVRTALINIDQTTRLIESTEVTVRLRVEELAAEIEKFRVGRSTQLLVAQAQRDLTTAQLQEISAKIANIKAYLQLYKAEGSTLQRSGIQPIHITEASGVPKD